MQCCHIKTKRKPHSSWWRSAGGCAGSGALLVLLPKCPLCIAAYLAMWTGASVAMPIATRLHPLLEIVFLVSAILLLVRSMATRTRHVRP